MNQQLEKRLAALEAASSADAIGILYETTADGQPDGLIRVNGVGVPLTLAEFRYDYPRGVLIRVRYGDGLPKADEGDT